MVLSESYVLESAGTLRRFDLELLPRFEAAFAAAEADLWSWMPSAAREQQDAASFIAWCVGAFEAARTFAYAIIGPSGDVIGYVNLTPESRHATVAYWVHPEWRGRGIAPLAVGVLVDAAFAAMPTLDRIHAHLDAGNEASRRVLDKAGFAHRQSFVRPPRTPAESDTEWLFVRERHLARTPVQE